MSLPVDIASNVRRALSEDIGSGDLTADLIPAGEFSKAVVICRERAVLCGTAWFNEVFRQLDQKIEIEWTISDGEWMAPDQWLCNLNGPTRALLSGERTALNYLQLLSGTATTTAHYTDLIKETGAELLDTRKTIPGLRTAQKYAVLCGGGKNHRMGLYDAILIKENHIKAAGSIQAAVEQAKMKHRQVEVEVEDLNELQQAIDAGADTILLDNFDLGMMRKTVEINGGRAKLEVSGGVDKENIRAIAATGIDYISVGALTKHLRAIDFSMRVV